MEINEIEMSEDSLTIRIDGEKYLELPSEVRKQIEGHERLFKTEIENGIEIGMGLKHH